MPWTTMLRRSKSGAAGLPPRNEPIAARFSQPIRLTCRVPLRPV